MRSPSTGKVGAGRPQKGRAAPVSAPPVSAPPALTKPPRGAKALVAGTHATNGGAKAEAAAKPAPTAPARSKTAKAVAAPAIANGAARSEAAAAKVSRAAVAVAAPAPKAASTPAAPAAALKISRVAKAVGAPAPKAALRPAEPAKIAPVKTAPVKTVPVKTAPVKAAPVKTAPAKIAPADLRPFAEPAPETEKAALKISLLTTPPLAPLAPAPKPQEASQEAPQEAPNAAPVQAKPAAPVSREIALPDFERLSRNIARFVEEGGKALGALLKPVETGQVAPQVGPSPEVAEVLTTLGRVAEYYALDGRRALEAQTALSTKFFELWGATFKKLGGEKATDVAPPEAGDKRFADPDWRDNPYFDFIKQAYILTATWADELVKRADDIDPHTRDKAAFYLKQITSALAPSNFLATNPELLRATLAESGDNLVRGMKMMAEDIEAGHGHLRIRQADAAKFIMGVNLAATPGKVVFRNELIELIQYAPTTPSVYKRPLLIIPPWINKFYVLDLNPEKSFIRWAVAQGLTVFVISWVNPDERHMDKGFEAYMREGIFASLEAIEAATGEREVATIGYCVGGTLLAVTLAFMAEIGDKRITSATFFTTQVDFTDPGDLKLFCDAEQLRLTEKKMAEAGYLEGSQMASAFNMLRPNDLIWSYWINNYLKGKEPMAFDLLVWNSDSTRMPAANHRFYLRHCYLQNDLTNDRLTIEGRLVSLRNVTIPVYDLAAKEDHIAPARSVFNGAKYFGGPVRYVMSGSGHIAGVVNPADKPKYQFWTGGPPEGVFEDWVAKAKETKGSWWVDWIAWITSQAPEKAAPREVGAGKLTPICDAPGEYVRVKA